LILIRHGESQGNAGGFIQGQLDFDLTLLGRAQAVATAGRLKGERIDRLVTSPLLRAASTASYFVDALSLAAESEPGLAEYDAGQVSGLTGQLVRERFPEVAAAWGRGERPAYPGEEGRAVFVARVRAVLDSMLGANEAIVAVAHGGVIGALCSLVVGREDHERPNIFRVSNCSLTEITEDRAGRLVLVRHNDTCHLEGVTAVDLG
jgi:probable phosphoglycerate mutase